MTKFYIRLRWSSSITLVFYSNQDFSECDDSSCNGAICADRPGHNPKFECLCTDVNIGNNCKSKFIYV